MASRTVLELACSCSVTGGRGIKSCFSQFSCNFRVSLKFNSGPLSRLQDVGLLGQLSCALSGRFVSAWLCGLCLCVPKFTVPISPEFSRAAFPEIRAPFRPMASPCPPRAARGALEFVLNPQPSSPPSHANTAKMQSPDHGPDEDALHHRIRTAKYAALKLAGKMAPRFANQFSNFKDVLNMDDMSGWPLLRQAKEWEGKLELLTNMDAEAAP